MWFREHIYSFTTLWYVNSEVINHLWMCVGIQGQTASSLRLVRWGRRLLRAFLFSSESSSWDGAEQDPVRLAQSRLPGAEGASCPASLPAAIAPRDQGVRVILGWSDLSALTIYCCNFILPSAHAVGPSGFSYIFEWLWGLQTQQIVNLCNATKQAEVKWWGICNL